MIHFRNRPKILAHKSAPHIHNINVPLFHIKRNLYLIFSIIMSEKT